MITAIVPARNMERSIGRCLASLVHQPEIERVIVADDASDDGTAAIAASYHPKVEIIARTERGGESAARMDGLQLVHTPYVTFVDADDSLSSHAAALSLKAAGAIGADLTQMRLVRRLGRWGLRIPTPMPADSTGSLEGAIGNEQAWPVSVCARLYRTDWLLSLDLPCHRLDWGEDRLWNLRMMTAHPIIALAPGARYNYFIGQSASQLGHRPHLDDMERVHALKREIITSAGLGTRALEAADTELVRLLGYELRCAADRGDLDPAAVELRLGREPWLSLGLNHSAGELVDKAMRSPSRKAKKILKLALSYLFY